VTSLAPLPAGRPQRLAFLGTPALAVPPLQALVDAGFEVVHVVTRPDKRRGRGSETSPSPVKAAAAALGIPASHQVDDLLAIDPPLDLAVVVAFGQMIKPHVLARLPMVNLHFSLLPRWRGAAPVERALLAGDASTGVCLMQVEEGLDTGGIFGCVEVPIGPDMTLDALRDALVARGSELLVKHLTAGLPAPVPQHGEVTYAPKIERNELRLDWERPAAELHRVVRTGQAWTTFRGRRLKVLDAVIVDEQLQPVIVQPEGKGPMAFADWARGARLAPGERLGS
jgi:methionyl-tRNA formyltransferase